MSTDTWVIIGAMGVGGAIIVSLGVVGLGQLGIGRLDDLRNDMIIGFDLLDRRVEDLDGDVANLRTDVRQMNDRLRNVEIAFGKLDQRLLTIEKVVIPAAESGR